MWGIGTALSAPGVVMAAADAGASGGLDLSNIITAGVTPALVLALILMGKLYPSGIVDSYKKRAEDAEAEAAKARGAAELLSGQMMDKVVPALTLATQVLDRFAPMLSNEALDYDRSTPRPVPRRSGR